MTCLTRQREGGTQETSRPLCRNHSIAPTMRSINMLAGSGTAADSGSAGGSAEPLSEPTGPMREHFVSAALDRASEPAGQDQLVDGRPDFGDRPNFESNGEARSSNDCSGLGLSLVH